MAGKIKSDLPSGHFRLYREVINGGIKEKVWQIKIDLKRDSKGKRLTKSKLFKGSERAAMKELARLQNHYAEHAEEELNCTDKTVGQYLESWLLSVKIEVRPRTWERYKGIVEQHLIPNLGDIALVDLKPNHVRKYFNRAAESGRLDGKGGLSMSSLKQTSIVLKRALNAAVEQDKLIKENPARFISIKDQRQIYHEDETMTGGPGFKVLSPDQLKMLLNRIKASVIYIATFIAASTGMRLSEVLGLTWKNVDFDEKTITVAQGLHWKKDGTWHIAYPKSKRSKRTIDIDDADVAVLKAQKAKQAQEKLLLGDQYHDHGFVCAKPDGSPMKQNTISNRFKRFAGGLGLPVSFHCLRHTHAKLLIENGMEMRTVSEKLGHYKPSFTWDRYTHFERSKHKQAAKIFHKVLSSCGSGNSEVVHLANPDEQ